MGRKDELMAFLTSLHKEAAGKIDELGYSFLESCGYETKKARKYPNERKALLKKLNADRAELRVNHKIDYEKGSIFFWYTFFKGGRKLAESDAIEFLFDLSED